MADTATFSAAMKTKFIGPIRDNIHKGKVLLFGDSDANPEDFKGIIPSAEGIDFVGNEFRIPLKAARNAAVGFRFENETLPAPGSASYTYIQEPMRYAYGLFNITGQLMKASEQNEGAFRSAFKAEMEDLTLQAKIDHNRAAFGDGSGKFCAITNSPAAGATTVNVDSTIYFRGGEVVDFVNAAGAVQSPAHTITGFNRTTLQLTFTPALVNGLTAATHFPVRASGDSSIATPNNSQNREIQGLASIVSATGVLHGLNPTSYPFWASQVFTNVGAINDTQLRISKDQIGFEAGVDLESGLDFALVTTRGIRRRYSDTLTSLKRFTDAESVKLHGGFTALMFDENPIFVDDQCPVGNIYGLALNLLFWSQLSDWEWMEGDGDVLKWEPRRDRYIAVLFKYSQLGTTQRNAHFRMSGVTDDAR